MPNGWLIGLGSGLLVVAGGMLIGELNLVAPGLVARTLTDEPESVARPPRRRRHADEARLERALAVERRRVRRAHRQERRAQRLLVMVRCLVGAGAVEELAERAVKAVLDDFGVESASIFAVTNGRPQRLAEAARRHVKSPSIHFMDAGELIPQVARPEPGEEHAAPAVVHCLPLRDERRRTIGFLVVGHALGRRPAGVEAYAAFVGQLMSAELGRNEAREEGVGFEAVLGAAA
jgi:hypothetical protein